MLVLAWTPCCCELERPLPPWARADARNSLALIRMGRSGGMGAEGKEGGAGGAGRGAPAPTEKWREDKTSPDGSGFYLKPEHTLIWGSLCNL